MGSDATFDHEKFLDRRAGVIEKFPGALAALPVDLADSGHRRAVVRGRVRELVRLVVVRDFPGHEKDDVFVSTDPRLSPRHIIESFSTRSRASSASRPPQNRTERAVERTAPLALISYSLTVLWYVQYGQRTRAARLPTLPWYTHKAGTTFSDMLATLRRASWSERLFDPASSTRDLRKRLRPEVDYVASAA